MRNLFTVCLLFCFATTTVCAQDNIDKYSWKKVAYSMPDNWYGSSQATEIADKIIMCQTNNGGWVKNLQYHKLKDFSKIDEAKKTGIGATIDNGSTIMEMHFLAHVYAKTNSPSYKDAFIKAVDFIFNSQYDNGGWPQFFPPRPNVPYSACITYNDNAIVNVMNTLKEIYSDASCVSPLKLSKKIKRHARESFKNGIKCILATQIKVDGKPTVWCAQHDHVTLAPAKARAYELPSFSSAESASIALLLMSIEHPSKDIIESVKGAVEWFDDHKIVNTKFIRCKDKVNGPDSFLKTVKGENTWGRFYDLETEKPFVSDRDGIKKSSLDDIGRERRNGYSWYVDTPQRVLDRYPDWLKINNLR